MKNETKNETKNMTKDLDTDELEQVNGGAGHYYLAARQEREAAEAKEKFEKEHPGHAEGTW